MSFISVLSDDLISLSEDNKPTIHKVDRLKQGLLIMGDLQASLEGNTIYPRFMAQVSGFGEKDYPLSSLTGRTMFNYARKVGKDGLAFTLSTYQAKMDKKSLLIDCIAWGKTAEMIERYAKDTQVTLHGAFKFEEYEGKLKCKLTASGFDLHSNKKETGNDTKSTTKSNYPVDSDSNNETF